MIDDLLSFWFADPVRWWRKDPAFDEEIRRRFGALHAEVAAGAHEDWRATPRGALAYVIVLDQLSRNLFRDQRGSFAYDGQALAAARAAVEQRFDAALTPQEASFFLMPFMHSEALADQERCVGWFRAAGTAPENLRFAELHRDIVARFGRFPHRNAILGRTSTDEERAFLAQPNSSF
jgi:uncharacterized protein (DUF924 family)